MTGLARAVSVALLLATLAVSQTNRGGITGTVFDSTGAVVPNALVVVTNVGTNQKTQETTTASGSFSVLSLDPALYKISVEAAGFKKSLVDNVKVDTASVATVNVTLEAGAVSSQVTVSAEAAMLNTESGTTGTTVTEREIQDVPLFNRSVLDLAVVQPGVTGDAGSENPGLSANATVPGFNLSVNGGRPGSTNILSDGVNNTGVSLGRTMVSFTPETVQEFTVQTSAYSAEYGQTGGGIINTTTKSGTNRFSGTALWYNRNPNFAAAPFTLATSRRSPPTLKDNQFSLTAGGPVVIPKLYNGRDKTFFFAAYEPHYRRDFLAQDSLQPLDQFRTGDFSGLVNTASGLLPVDVAKQFNQTVTGDATIYQNYSLVASDQFVQLPAPTGGATYAPFPGNKIPLSLLDKTAVKALAYIPAGNGFYLNGGGTVSNLFNPRLSHQDDTRYTFRIDQFFNDNNHVNFRYTATPIVKTQVTPTAPTGAGAEYSYAKQAMAAYTHTFSPSITNDLRLNYTRGRFSSTTSPQYDPFTGTNLNTALGLPSLLPGGVPSLPYIGGQGSTENNDVEERYNVSDLLYINHGRMSWKVGVDISHSLQNVLPLYAAIGGVYSFSATQTNSNGATNGTGGNSFASFMLGVPSGITFRNVLIPYYYRWNAGAAFVQNDWKVKPNLTLNLGLRYTLSLPRTEKYDHQGVFLPDQAQSFALPSPLTLTDGEVIKSVQVPPFAFAGKGGRSRYLYPANYKEFEPRFGFAWTPEVLQAQHITVRGGYGLSHAPVTGSARLPNPDFGATSSAWGPTSGQANSSYITRLGENPPVIQAVSPDQAIGAPSNGLVYLNSLNYQGIGGFAVSKNVHTPYSQNWNFTLSWQANHNTSIELTYVGNKGTHLFMPRENVNPKDLALLNAQDAANINTTATVNDPLGRVGPNGRVLTVQNGSLGSPFLGFSSLTQLYDASANSIRHAAYINVTHRAAKGLTFTSNYTFGKTIDDASDSGVDKNVQTTGRVDGQVALGGTRKNDRSVAIFDVRHVFNNTVLYDLPFGKGRMFLANAWKPLDLLVGGWTTSGIIRFNSGYPAMVTLSDTNQLGDLTHTARPNIIPGVPLVNPLWSRNCPTGGGCQPYLNPSAFERPDQGALGTAPRTLDGARGPWDQYFDASIQKNFKLGESGQRRIQFRVDLLNAFNHPDFRVYLNNAGGTDFMGAPSTATLSAADYNTWASANNQPQSTTAAGAALMNQIISTVNGAKVNGVLPINFFTVPLPDNFYGKTAASYDITTLGGYKLFRLRQTFAAGTPGFGQLYQSGQPRYIQFGLKIYF